MPSSGPDFNLVWESKISKVTIFWILQTLAVHANSGVTAEPNLQPFKEATGIVEQEIWLN